MSFARRGGRLFAEDAALSEIAAEYGTPCYVYSQAALKAGWKKVRDAFPRSKPRMFFAVKANGNLSVLKLFRGMEAGFDIVSGGEMERALATGAPSADIVFSGVGKSAAEIGAALNAGVGCINVESEGEIIRTEEIAKKMNAQAPVAVRVTPGIDGGTHPYLSTGVMDSKFGVSFRRSIALAEFVRDSNHMDFLGFACHIGSQIRDSAVYVEAVRAMTDLLGEAQKRRLKVRHVDMGGGFAVDYEKSSGLDVNLSAYDEALADMKKKFDIEVWLEPGRAAAAAGGVLLTRVEYVKRAGDWFYTGDPPALDSPEPVWYWIVDAGMNDLLRPALYGARHAIENIESPADTPKQTGSVAGPVCESADVLARGVSLAAEPGDILAVRDAGAYCASMMSSYNARPRPCEVMVSGSSVKLIRRRETTESMLADEKSLL